MSAVIPRLADSYVIRPSDGRERMAWRMLLPALSDFTQRLIVYVAVENSLSGRVVRAAALGVDPGLWVERGVPLDVHVIASCRRQGLGRRLVDALAEDAARQRIEAAFGWPWFTYDEGGADPCIDVWRRLGFEPWQREFTYETTIERALAGIEPV